MIMNDNCFEKTHSIIYLYTQVQELGKVYRRNFFKKVTKDEKRSGTEPKLEAAAAKARTEEEKSVKLETLTFFGLQVERNNQLMAFSTRLLRSTCTVTRFGQLC